MKISLSPDYCCGGGHCGPMPGYYYICPHCEEESQCRTGYELEEGQQLKCVLCKGEIHAAKKISDFSFEFELVSQN